MKRILFYSENFCGDKSKGGLEVATYRIAKALKDYGGYEVYDAFRSKWDNKDKSVYHDVIKLSKNNSAFESELSKFIRDRKIDIVVNMTRFYRHDHIVKAIGKSDRKVKVVFMQHFAPGSEFKKGTYTAGWHLLKLNPLNPLYWLRASVYPLLKLPRNKRLGRLYREVYKESDKVILLSEGYKKDYCEIAKLEDTSKFTSIANIFDCYGLTNKDESDKKEKRVLILSRMDEVQKRISIALEIWRNIEKDIDFQDWHLDIVGTGHNTDIVKRLIKKKGLKNVTMHGWQPRIPYLERSSILMMTSEYEGLPLSVLEAQAYGVVPIAFDSYASLRDVISPFENGVVVEKFGDIDDFTAKLKDLMNDEPYRKELSEKAIAGANKFSSEKIGAQWNKMLKDL